MSEMWLTDKQFYQESANRCECRDWHTVQKYFEACMDTFIRHMYLYGQCRVPIVGKFTTKQLPEGFQTQTQPDGTKKRYKVPERVLPIYTPTPDFIDDINMTIVTKATRKRLKNGQLTQRDYIRMLRASDIDRKPERPSYTFDEEAKETMSKLMKEKAKENNKQ